jgi:hypothetical protein
MSDVTHAHSLASTFETLGALSSYLKVRVEQPEGEGWLPATNLSDSATSYHATLRARIGARYSTTDRHFIAMTLFSNAMWQVVVAGFASYLVARRVPDLRRANIALHWDEHGWAETLALASGRFAALPDDPAIGHPDLDVLPDRDTLRGRLIEHLVGDFLPPLVDHLSAISPLGQRVLWSVVADRCAGTIIWLCEELGLQSICRAEVDALLQAVPHGNKTGILTIDHNGQQHMFLRRGTCCLSYKTPAHDYCSTCPLLPEDERVRRLRDYMARQVAA